MKKAIITGVLGQDGYFLARQLSEKGYEILGVSKTIDEIRANQLKKEIPNIQLFKIDITNSEQIGDLIDRWKPNEIYNLAGFSSVRDSWKNPDLVNEINHGGIKNILSESLRHQDKFKRSMKIYQASSSEIFGSTISTPQNESTAFAPTSPYGHSKLAGHLEAVRYREKFGLFVSIGILFNHESHLRSPQFVTRKISLEAAKIYSGIPSKLVLGNMNAARDWGYAPDYVDAMWRMMDYPNPDTFVIATGVSTSVSQIAQFALNYVGVQDWQSLIEFDSKEIRPIEPTHLVGDFKKALNLLGWKPSRMAKEIIETMVDEDIRELNSKK